MGGVTFGRQYQASWTNTLEPGIEIGSVVLMRPAALTHHDDGGQRMVRLAMEQNPDGNGGGVLFKAPANNRVADTGWWMLFLVTTSGRPSLAYWVHLQ